MSMVSINSKRQLHLPTNAAQKSPEIGFYMLQNKSSESVCSTGRIPKHLSNAKNCVFSSSPSSSPSSSYSDSATSASAETMKIEVEKLIGQVENQERELHFKEEMNAFFHLFYRYLNEKGNTIQWDKIESPTSSQIIPYASLEPSCSLSVNEMLNRLAVIKLNGGLGTSMGCIGPKSAIEVRDSLTFLDMTVKQIEYLNESQNTDIPLILMNSFNTDEETKKIIQKYSNHNIDIITFNQSKFPRIEKDSLTPVATTPFADKKYWYPPGHGDFFQSIDRCGLLDKLIGDEKDYIFISNVDNLGATIDTRILAHLIESQAEFIMEVTDKTKADIKGGTLINYGDGLRLLEIAQVPSEHLTDFTSIKKFKIFNTNNIWISTRALKKILIEQSLDLEIIVNPKCIENDGRKIIQLETAIGSAIKHFGHAHAINVPRSRFLPVKNCSDLFLVQSDLYVLSNGSLTLNPKRQFSNVPLIKLGDGFRKVNSFLSRFQSPPRIIELDHLTVMGDVNFGSSVTLKGTVIIVANTGTKIDIPSGAILEDKVVSGNLSIMDH